MKRISSRQSIFLILLVAGLCSPASAVSPTFADLAVYVAKGYFKYDVPRGASLEQCSAFLNRQGVCFSLFDLMDPGATVAREDFARAVGQSTLLFLGEGEGLDGCVEKPADIKTWVDYCLLNDIDLPDIWSGFLQRMEKGHFLEVEQFFGDQVDRGENR